jgi:hypothetical protein
MSYFKDSPLETAQFNKMTIQIYSNMQSKKRGNITNKWKKLNKIPISVQIRLKLLAHSKINQNENELTHYFPKVCILPFS